MLNMGGFSSVRADLQSSVLMHLAQIRFGVFSAIFCGISLVIGRLSSVMGRYSSVMGRFSSVTG